MVVYEFHATLAPRLWVVGGLINPTPHPSSAILLPLLRAGQRCLAWPFRLFGTMRPWSSGYDQPNTLKVASSILAGCIPQSKSYLP